MDMAVVKTAKITEIIFAVAWHLRWGGLNVNFSALKSLLRPTHRLNLGQEDNKITEIIRSLRSYSSLIHNPNR